MKVGVTEIKMTEECLRNLFNTVKGVKIKRTTEKGKSAFVIDIPADQIRHGQEKLIKLCVIEGCRCPKLRLGIMSLAALIKTLFRRNKDD